MRTHPLGGHFLNLEGAQACEGMEAGPYSATAGLSQHLGLRACALLPLATAEGLLGLPLLRHPEPSNASKKVSLICSQPSERTLALALRKEGNEYRT